MIAVLQLLVLILIGYLLWKLMRVLAGVVNRFNELTVSVDRLYRPTQEEIIGEMTIAEAQKEAIRARSIIVEWMELFSNMLSNKIMRGLSGK